MASPKLRQKLNKAGQIAEVALGAATAFSAIYGGAIWLAGKADTTYQDVFKPLGSAILRNGTAMAKHVGGYIYTFGPVQTGIKWALMQFNTFSDAGFAGDYSSSTVNMTADTIQRFGAAGNNFAVHLGQVGVNTVNATLYEIDQVPVSTNMAPVSAAHAAATASFELATVTLVVLFGIAALRRHYGHE